ncbi:hypothetical protein BpHYR1_017296 [Brachionus plicatilis]|uniref:Uncharacterized protein n=1 Tax=Brachionus plicatilis TaxID=10195 RepID=A0A3M7R533_BRAPC|nr:hypothetical protein BpHYR1_017296 [Brachionus plicatilis]
MTNDSLKTITAFWINFLSIRILGKNKLKKKKLEKSSYAISIILSLGYLFLPLAQSFNYLTYHANEKIKLIQFE